MPIHVAIADDHRLILSSLTEAFKTTDYILVSGAYANGEQLLEALPVTQPDIVILDYHLPDYNGAHLARYIAYHFPTIRIIALTGYDKPGLATEMLESGCAGFLLKSSAEADTIIDAVDTVYEGRFYLDTALRQKFSNTIQDNLKEATQEKPNLTNRELEILECIVEGLSRQEIAEKLYISKKTVDNHRTSILLKIGEKSTAGLIRFAIEMKLI